MSTKEENYLRNQYAGRNWRLTVRPEDLSQNRESHGKTVRLSRSGPELLFS